MLRATPAFQILETRTRANEYGSSTYASSHDSISLQAFSLTLHVLKDPTTEFPKPRVRRQQTFESDVSRSPTWLRFLRRGSPDKCASPTCAISMHPTTSFTRHALGHIADVLCPACAMWSGYCKSRSCGMMEVVGMGGVLVVWWKGCMLGNGMLNA